MIIHLFNSSVVSGPERLVIPAIASAADRFAVVNLVETRLATLSNTDPLKIYAQAHHLRYEAVPVRSRWDRQTLAVLRHLFHTLKPELVHAHAIKASVYVGHLQVAGNPFPVVSTHHGVHGLPDWKYRIYEWYYRKKMLPRFDRVIAVSPDDRDVLAGSGISAGRLRLQRNGIDRARVPSDQRAAASRRIRALWFPHEPEPERWFVFGVVARLSQEKDYPRLLAVLARLKGLSTAIPWRCLIFGTGDLEASLKLQAKRLGLEDRLIWMGYREGVGDELAGLDVLLSLSKAEGLPINLIEAGWAGTPVCATPVGGIKELIPDERYGTWITIDEAPGQTAERLQRLMTDGGRREGMEQGRLLQARVAEEFSQASWWNQLRGIYAELGVDLQNAA